VTESKLDSSGTEKGKAAGFCENGNEYLDFIEENFAVE
jgi:hypothetical protein